MKMKQIQAKDMQEAMALARRDMGEDAILLNTRKVPKGLIVTFGMESFDEPLPIDPADLGVPQIVKKGRR